MNINCKYKDGDAIPNPFDTFSSLITPNNNLQNLVKLNGPLLNFSQHVPNMQVMDVSQNARYMLPLDNSINLMHKPHFSSNNRLSIIKMMENKISSISSANIKPLIKAQSSKNLKFYYTKLKKKLIFPKGKQSNEIEAYLKNLLSELYFLSSGILPLEMIAGPDFLSTYLSSDDYTKDEKSILQNFIKEHFEDMKSSLYEMKQKIILVNKSEIINKQLKEFDNKRQNLKGKGKWNSLYLSPGPSSNDKDDLVGGGVSTSDLNVPNESRTYHSSRKRFRNRKYFSGGFCSTDYALAFKAQANRRSHNDSNNFYHNDKGVLKANKFKSGDSDELHKYKPKLGVKTRGCLTNFRTKSINSDTLHRQSKQSIKKRNLELAKKQRDLAAKKARGLALSKKAWRQLGLLYKPPTPYITVDTNLYRTWDSDDILCEQLSLGLTNQFFFNEEEDIINSDNLTTLVEHEIEVIKKVKEFLEQGIYSIDTLSSHTSLFESGQLAILNQSSLTPNANYLLTLTNCSITTSEEKKPIHRQANNSTIVIKKEPELELDQKMKVISQEPTDIKFSKPTRESVIKFSGSLQPTNIQFVEDVEDNFKSRRITLKFDEESSNQQFVDEEQPIVFQDPVSSLVDKNVIKEEIEGGDNYQLSISDDKAALGDLALNSTSKVSNKTKNQLSSKQHWDYLEEEMSWLSFDFAQEHRWKVAIAKKIGRHIQKYFEEKLIKHQKLENEEIAKIKKIAVSVSKIINKFWKNIAKIAVMKVKAIEEAKHQKRLDKQLNAIVGQTEKFSNLISQQFINQKAITSSHDKDVAHHTIVKVDTKPNLKRRRGRPISLKTALLRGELPKTSNLEVTKSLSNASTTTKTHSTKLNSPHSAERLNCSTKSLSNINQTLNDSVIKIKASRIIVEKEAVEDNVSNSNTTKSNTRSAILNDNSSSRFVVEPSSNRSPTSPTNSSILSPESTELTPTSIQTTVNETRSFPRRKRMKKDMLASQLEIRDEIFGSVTKEAMERCIETSGTRVLRNKVVKIVEAVNSNTTSNVTNTSHLDIQSIASKFKNKINVPPVIISNGLHIQSEMSAIKNPKSKECDRDVTPVRSNSPCDLKLNNLDNDRFTYLGKGPDLSNHLSKTHASLNGGKGVVPNINHESESSVENYDDEDDDYEETINTTEIQAKTKRSLNKRKKKKCLPNSPVKSISTKCSDDGKQDSESLNDIAAEAQKFHPKGHTLQTTQVTTDIPFLLKHQLREYQHIGLDWLSAMYERKLNGILADEMGLGKTIQTISLLAHLACSKGVWGPHLIVVPTSVMLNWEMEFKKWCPGFRILTYYGSPKERRAKRKGWSGNAQNNKNCPNVVITSYRLVLQDERCFKRKHWHYFILDEAQNIKNFKSQRWISLLNFKSRARLLLTGTPLQNDLMEVWSLMHFLMPNVFTDSAQFSQWFARPLNTFVSSADNLEYRGDAKDIIYNSLNITSMPDDSSLINSITESAETMQLVAKLHKILRPFILRRLKKEVEKQMPGKYEHVIKCRLSKRQTFLYHDFVSRSTTQSILENGNFLGVINVLMQLRKVCNHPNLFEERPVLSPFKFTILDDINRFPRQMANSPAKLKYSDKTLTNINQSLRYIPSIIRHMLIPPKNATLLQQDYPSKHEGDVNCSSISSNNITSYINNQHGHVYISNNEQQYQHHRLLKTLNEHTSNNKLMKQQHHNPLSPNLLLPSNSLHISNIIGHKFHYSSFGRSNLFGLQYLEFHYRDSDGSYQFKPRTGIIMNSPSFLFRPINNNHSKLMKNDKIIDRLILLNYANYLEVLDPILKRFIIYTPPAVTDQVEPYVSHIRTDLIARQHYHVKQIHEFYNHIFNVASINQEIASPLRNLVVESFLKFPDRRLIEYDCGKLQVLKHLLAQLHEEKHRVLIFTQMTRVLDILESFLNYHGYRYSRLDGTTKIEQRQILMDRFNNDDKIFCFILSTRSGGLGINLTGADTVIFYDSDWNPTMDAQAQDRCHRIGQTKSVHIYRLISEYTVEESILLKARQKRLLTDISIEEGNFTTAFFRKEGLKELFGDDENSLKLDINTQDSTNVADPISTTTNQLSENIETEKQEIPIANNFIDTEHDFKNRRKEKWLEEALALTEETIDSNATRSVLREKINTNRMEAREFEFQDNEEKGIEDDVVEVIGEDADKSVVKSLKIPTTDYESTIPHILIKDNRLLENEKYVPNDLKEFIDQLRPIEQLCLKLYEITNFHALYEDEEYDEVTTIEDNSSNV